jgi:hypothetical protein
MIRLVSGFSGFSGFSYRDGFVDERVEEGELLVQLDAHVQRKLAGRVLKKVHHFLTADSAKKMFSHIT